jgi:hypothetical protein
LGRRRKLFERILSSRSDANIPFDQSCALPIHLGFQERTSGKHQHKFFREDVEELINLQEVEGGKCKPYQVKQMREVFLKYNLGQEL